MVKSLRNKFFKGSTVPREVDLKSKWIISHYNVVKLLIRLAKFYFFNDMLLYNNNQPIYESYNIA